MKVIKGVPVNIDNVVIGRITRTPLGRFRRKDSILVTNDFNTSFTGYAGVITNRHSSESLIKELNHIPFYYQVSELDYLHDGDVVSLDKEGNKIGRASCRERV